MPTSSKQEDARYLILKSNKNITHLKRQIVFRAVINEIEVFTYTADFAYVENGEKIIEEFKPHAFERHDYQLRLRVCSALYPKLIFRTQDLYKRVRDYRAGKCVYFYKKPRKKKGRPKL